MLHLVLGFMHDMIALAKSGDRSNRDARDDRPGLVVKQKSAIGNLAHGIGPDGEGHVIEIGAHRIGLDTEVEVDLGRLVRRLAHDLEHVRAFERQILDELRVDGDLARNLVIRRAVSTLGLRYTVSNKDLPGSPDLANRSRRWAIFVHGCYWHRHAGCHKATTPRTNTEFWLNKFSRNMARDEAARVTLKCQGYRVLTFWQCELESSEPVARRLAQLTK